MGGSGWAPGRRAVSVRGTNAALHLHPVAVFDPWTFGSMLSPILRAQTKARRSRRWREQETYGTRGASPCYGDKIIRRGEEKEERGVAFPSPHVSVRPSLARPVLARGRAEAYAARLRDGGRGGEGAPAAASGAPGCGGAVPSGERRLRRARLLRGARRRGYRLRLLDVCQRQSKKVPLQTPTSTLFFLRRVQFLF